MVGFKAGSFGFSQIFKKFAPLLLRAFALKKSD